MTDVIQLLSFLDNILGSHTPTQRNEYLWRCPFCSHHKQKLAINMSTGQWHCWVCSTAGRNLFGLLKRMGIKNKYQELGTILGELPKYKIKKDVETVLTLPSEYKPVWKIEERNLEGRHAFSYLFKRGIPADQMMKYRLGYCETGDYANRIIIPSYDADDKLNFFVGRAYYESTMPYKNPTVSKNVVGFESLISWKFPLIICEGPMDAMAIRRNAVPLFGSTLQSELLDKIISNNVKEVVLALDADAERQTYKIAHQLIQEGVAVRIIDMQGRDPNELGFDFMSNEIRNQKDFTSFSDVVRARTVLA